MFLMAVAAALMCGCEKELKTSENVVTGDDVVVSGPTKKFTFTVKGDFGSPTFRDGDQGEASVNGTGSAAPRRSATYLTDENNQMTDLWVFDFVGDDCVQSLHQTTSDATWGQPQMSLALGTHHIYFVASRGVSPVVNATDKTIVWSSVRDTYWKDYEVTVVNTSNGNRAVTLDRVVAKLKLTVNDEIPTGASTLTCTPASWHYGMNYTTGAPIAATSDQPITINIPSSYIGTTGQLSASFFTFSGADEWTTNVSLAVKDGNSNALGSVAISDVPLKRNRSTEYSGSLFSGSSAVTVSVNGDWLSPHVGAW